jgi:hypothetical protein
MTGKFTLLFSLQHQGAPIQHYYNGEALIDTDVVDFFQNAEQPISEEVLKKVYQFAVEAVAHR